MLRKLSLHRVTSKARGSEEGPRAQDSPRQLKAPDATDSAQLSQSTTLQEFEDQSIEDGSEDFSHIASLLQTFSSISGPAGKVRQVANRRKTVCPMVLPDIPEKISLEDWSVKACCIEDIVYPSARNSSYLTSSTFAAFTDQASCADESRSSLFPSSFTGSSSTLSLSADEDSFRATASQQDKKTRHSQRRMDRAAGLQCRRNENPDIVVLLGGTRFPCHRALLSVHSQYFHEILAANPHIQKLELQGVSGDAFHTLLDYMYSGKLHLTCQNIGKLYVTASILKIARIKKKCAKVLTKSPYDPKHAVYVYVTARKYGLISVCKRALKLLHHRLEETVTCKPFLDLDVNQVCEVLSGNSVGARSEMVIFLAALHWLNHNYLENEPYVLKVLQCVRFSTMGIEELLCCLHPPLLPGIMEVHEVRSHVLSALCYKVAAMYNQQHLFPMPQVKPRYFKLDGPVTLWDMSMFSGTRTPSGALPPSSNHHLKYMNDVSSNILRKAPTLPKQFQAQRPPMLHGDPLADYLLRNRAEIPLSVWSEEPYESLGSLAAGHARDVRSPVLLAVGGFNPDAPGETAVGTKILRYHIEKNTWEKFDTFPMPRHHHCAVLHGDKLYITGGYDNYQSARSTLEPTSMCFSYDLAKRLWQPLPNMTRSRAYHAAACIDGTLIVIGGRSTNGEILASVEAMCLEERRWQELPCRLCRPRMAAGSAVMGGRLWIAGGLTDSRAGLVVISDVDCFDPRTYEFNFHVSFLPTPRCFFSLVSVGDKLFALGGCSVQENGLGSLGDVWACQDYCWERKGTFDQGYHDVSTVAYGENVYMIGGLSSDTKAGIRAVSCYRTSTNTFQPNLAPLPKALCGAAVVVLPPLCAKEGANGGDGKWPASREGGSDVETEPTCTRNLVPSSSQRRPPAATDSGRGSSASSLPPPPPPLPPGHGGPWLAVRRLSSEHPPSLLSRPSTLSQRGAERQEHPGPRPAFMRSPLQLDGK